ncbi:Predicted periplasmic solute-binding protein [uncultured Alphaproteobacteria bacterium]|uniref:Endolytic murein transglycosylase n=1 Tax=uncultured Alphaproteobacteria bacterium TaxID=91750 RepID=A0A212KLA0_9PROT|nr:Predicted periplasmic solute-binding protein [uncultured Alphaproteobacteria bacterium]
MATLRRTGVVLVALLALAAAAAAVVYVKGREAFYAPGPSTSETVVVIPKGAGTGRIAELLADAGVIADPLAFRVAARLTEARLKAGEFAFPAGASAAEAMAVVASGKVVQHFLTIPEGWTVKQALAAVAAAPALDGEAPAALPEGALLPETYAYVRGETRARLVARMRAAMESALAAAWAGRAEGLPFKTPEEALTLASIVERETGVAEERPRVAAVFVNRLRFGMKLQSDPTVIYGLSDGAGVLDRSLTRKDLEADHPYNTYEIDGLPPGPIALPGLAAIRATLDPADTRDLYFVADGSGGHVFARSLDEHNRNVAKWRALERAQKSR